MNKFGYFSQSSKPGDKACLTYNHGNSTSNATHTLDLTCVHFAHALPPSFASIWKGSVGGRLKLTTKWGWGV